VDLPGVDGPLFGCDDAVRLSCCGAFAADDDAEKYAMADLTVSADKKRAS